MKATVKTVVRRVDSVMNLCVPTTDKHTTTGIHLIDKNDQIFFARLNFS